MRACKWLGIELVEVSWAEKTVSAVGSCLAIFCVFCVTRYSLPAAAAAGVIGSMGATAMLLYAVPHGPLSQPWPLIGGHTISAIIGVCCAHSVDNTAVATALAVGLAIGVMYQCKCIHPPGGATAFTAVMGGSAVHELGFTFVLYPVLLNALVMLVLAIVINYPFRWRRYPAFLVRRFDEAEPESLQVSEDVHKHVLASIRSLESFVDVSEDDLLYLASDIAARVGNANGSEAVAVQRSVSSDRWNDVASDEPERALTP
tara:strand:- start:49564 stop:50340 length:777 start_codon:yes stop_codon:yes gene_type:complete